MLIPRKSINLTQEIADSLFAECNKTYFNNKLKKIPIILVSDIKNNGMFKFDIDLEHNTYTNMRIELSTGHRRTMDLYKNTMIHELTHYMVLAELTDKKKSESIEYYRDGLIDKFEKLLLIGQYAHTGKWKKTIQKINNTYHRDINIPEIEDDIKRSNRLT